ncbi:MAG: hypothetical protein AB1489_28350 [Acidobacteriota bacterium]
MITSFDVDHRRTLQAYLDYRGYRHKVVEKAIEGETKNGEKIYAAFDQIGRLVNISILPV